MPSAQNNLFLRLHKWAVRQDENFLTDAFAYVLQHMLDNEPEAAAKLFNDLTNSFLKIRPEDTKAVELRTQVTMGEGTPDFEIRWGAQLVLVEVKSESPADPEQLKKFRAILKKSGFPSTYLVLLTRYPATIEEEKARPDFPIRWYQVAEWIDQQRKRYSFQPVTAYLVDQFLGFLEARNMTMSQVTWELSGGVRALRTLTDMLYEAATACGVKAQAWGNRDWMGVNLERGKYRAGIWLDQPEVLYFETYVARVNKDAAERLEGEIFECKGSPGGYGWLRKLDLESETVHFFARSKASQIQELEKFLRGCLDDVKPLVLAGKEGPPAGEAASEGNESGPLG